MQVYIVGRPASMVADGRAFDVRHLKSVCGNWAVLPGLGSASTSGTLPGAASGCTCSTLVIT